MPLDLFAESLRGRRIGLRALSAVLCAALCVGARAQNLFDHAALAFDQSQADRGKAAYIDNCASCHGPNLDDGQFGPPVKGSKFHAHWHDQSADALLTLIVQRMPPSNPGSLPRDTYRDIEAYLAQQNGEAAGAAAGAPREAVRSEYAPAVKTLPQVPIQARIDNEDDAYRAAMAAQRKLLEVTPVTEATLRAPAPSDWLFWRGSYATLGYSALTQISTTTVPQLTVAWTLSLPPSANEAAPLVHDGVLYVESADTIEAVDASDGSILWQNVRTLPEALHQGREARMKGLAILGTTLYAPTADGHIVALDAKSGAVLWDHAVVPESLGVRPGLFDGAYFHISGGPLVVHGKVIVGVSLGINTGGGDYIVGLDAQTGNETWRFDTIAKPGQPGGDSWNGAPVNERFGSGVWTIGSYDPDANLVYFGTGNTYDVGTLLQPRAHAHPTNNDALYTDSTVALNPDTGKLGWYYQHMNRDVWDLDWVFEQTLISLPVQGKPTPMVVTGGKSAIFDVVNATDGKYQFSEDLGVQNLVKHIDPKTGKKMIEPALEPHSGRTDIVCPAATGARNWPTTAFDPASHFLFVPLVENRCMDYTFTARDADKVAAGGMDIRIAARLKPDNDGHFGRIMAIDLQNRRIAWTVRQRAPIASSMLATAGGLAFNGSRDRYFRAYDSATGTVLWQARLNASPSSSPATYSVDGVQYVVVIAGGGGAFDAAGHSLTPEIVDAPAGLTLWAFRLNDAKQAPARR